MIRKFDIVIAGAGMVGLAVAALLARSPQREHMRLHVVDAGQRPGYDAEDETGVRVSAISLGSAAHFSAAGCWERIVAARVCPFRNMRVWDASGSVDGPETLRFDASEFAVPQLGFIVENMLIQSTLVAQLESTGTSVDFATAIRDVARADDTARIELADGRTIAADLLIAADGGRSFVRDKVGIGLNAWRYPQTAFVTHLIPQFDHRNTAWQRFLPSGPVALLPLSDGRVSTVWSTTAEQAKSAMAANEQHLGRLLSEATDGVLGSLSPAGPRATFPLHAQHADRYVLPGVALVGDAAHSVHPLAGQGVNLGLADAACIATIIADALAADEYPGDLPVLRRYERARKGANKTMLHFIDGVSRLFAIDSASAARIRGGGMRLFNKSGALRQHAVEVALGLRT